MIDIFKNPDDTKVIVARLVSGGLTIQRIADFLGVGYTPVYNLVKKIQAEIDEGVKLKRGRMRAVVRQEMVLPPKCGRRVPREKIRQVEKLLTTTNLTQSEIARQVGLKTRFPILRVRNELRTRAERRAGDFQPKQAKRGKTYRCEIHGPVTIWPCVACAAESERRRRLEERKKQHAS